VEEVEKMDERPVRIASELIRIYGYSLLEDPDRLAQLLEDRCADAVREIFLISFALREILKYGSLPAPEVFLENMEKTASRLCVNLGFSKPAADWVTRAIYKLLRTEVETDCAEFRMEAHRGFLQNIGKVMAKHPRTMLFRKKALRDGLLLLAIITLFLGLFIRITESRYPVSDEHSLLFLAHLSGPEAALGHVRLKAAQLAVDQINAVGGVKGRTLRISAHDIPHSPEDAIKAANELMRDKSCAAAVSVCQDAVNIAIAGIADAREMPLVVTGSSGIQVTMAAGDRPRLYPFRLNYDNRYRGYLAAYFLVQGLKRIRPAVVCEAYDSDSYEMRDAFRAAIDDLGGVISCEEVWTKAGGIDRASVEEIKMSDSDVVVILNDTPDVVSVMDSLRRFGYGGAILGLSFDDALDAAGGSGLDDSWWIVPSHQDDPQLQSFQSAYRDKYNENIPKDDFSGTMLAYDAIFWTADALLRAPGFQGEALRHAFMSTRNLALSHATLTIDPRTHGPWNKASALLYRSSGSAKFQRRFRPQ
jgi:branched-chain amino acid transport system substrate-binding protein